LKALRSAVANAKNNQLDTAKLYIKEIRVDQGPRLKRWTPRARGAVSMIEKKMSHVTIVLGEAEKPFATRFVLPEKPKKKEVKEEKKKDVEEDREKKMRTEERPIAPVRPAAKSGLFQKVFRRKSI
jgi:hypothetical protein